MTEDGVSVWLLTEQQLKAMLDRVFMGETPEAVMLEVYANAEFHRGMESGPEDI